MIKNSLLIITLAFVLPACSIFGGVTEKVAGVIDDYCTKEPFSARQIYRQQINAQLAAQGHSITVDCAGDPAPTP